MLSYVCIISHLEETFLSFPWGGYRTRERIPIGSIPACEISQLALPRTLLDPLIVGQPSDPAQTPPGKERTILL